MRWLYGFLSRHAAHAACSVGLLACLLWAVNAQAQALPKWSAPPTAVATTSGYKLGYSGIGQAVQSVARAGAIAANDAVAIGETVSLATPAGAATVTLTRSVAGAAVRSAMVDAALGFARGGVVGAGAVAAAALLSPLADKFMRDMGYEKGSDGSWGVPGTVNAIQVPGGMWCYAGVCARSFDQVMLNYLGDNLYSAGGRCDGYVGDPTAPTDGMVYCVHFWSSANGAGQLPYAKDFLATYHTQARNICPDGEDAPPSGECPGGEPRPVDLAQAKQKAAGQPMPATVSDWAPVVDAMETTGYAPPPDTAVTVSGATQVSGQPVVSTETVTDAAGNAQTLTTTETPVTYLDYYGDEVNMRTEVTKTVTKPDGSTQTTTNQVGSNSSDNPCFGLGSILGCTPLGTPEAASVPTATKQITFSAEDVSLPSACPAPISVGRFGSISFQSACDSAGYMRPLILAGASIAGLMICMAAVSGARS